MVNKIFRLNLIALLTCVLFLGCASQKGRIVFVEYHDYARFGWDLIYVNTLKRASFLKAMLDCYGDDKFYDYVSKLYKQDIVTGNKRFRIAKKDLTMIEYTQQNGQIISWNHIVYPKNEQLTCTADSNTKRLLGDDNYLNNILNSYKKQIIFEARPSNWEYTSPHKHTDFMLLYPEFVNCKYPFNAVCVRDTFFNKSKQEFLDWYKDVLDSMLRLTVRYRNSFNGPIYDSRERPFFKTKKHKR